MRRGMGVGVAIVLFLGLQAAAQQSEPPGRYGVLLNQRLYPQETPKETLASVVSALDNGRIDYVLAELTDPAFIDERLQKFYRGDFDELVAEASLKLADDPSPIKLLQRFLKEGDWQENATTASARLKDVSDSQVYLRKVGTRWYLENRQKPELPKEE
jgi:hypothetical protein